MCTRPDGQVGTKVSADLGIEEHVLANGQAQRVLGCLKGESEEPGVVRQSNLLRQLEWDLLLWIECHLGGGVATAAHSKLALITHLLPVTHQVRQCTLTACSLDIGGTSQQDLYINCSETIRMRTTEGCAK